ncbi:MAG: hypothetical protein CVV18_03710 [Gammaproteobacteria bacterium HGW-Gammaproteobacteria-8]|nr:MAG: hypothetical protein CVV18_03710 [Gammaproteobacteria bacterium HGW-Gammaproteobacteria-8]
MNSFGIRVALLLLAGLVAGCQTGPIRLTDASLQFDLEGLERTHDGLTMSVLVLNPNDHSVLVGGASLSFALEDQQPLTLEVPLNLDIAPRNRERIRVLLPPDRKILEMLGELDDGARARLSYRLEIELQLQDSRPTGSRIDAFLHRVPGQTGRYR